MKIISWTIFLAIFLTTLAALFSIYVDINTVNPMGQFTLVTQTPTQQQQQPIQPSQNIVPEQPRTQQTLIEDGDAIYVQGVGLVARKNQEGITYYHQDYLSSNRFSTDEDEKLSSKSVYYPYGSTLNEAGSVSKYKFTGKEQDDSLYYYGARYYDSSTSRFISTDPVFSPAASGYAYAADNPLRYGDPDGKNIFDFIKNNKVAILRVAALGVISYQLSQGTNPLKNPAGITSSGIVGYGLIGAVATYNSFTPDEQRKNLYSSTPSRDRLSLEDIQFYSNFIRQSCIGSCDEIATALENKAREGLLFSSIEHNGVYASSSSAMEMPLIGYIDGIGMYFFRSFGFVDPKTGVSNIGGFDLFNPNIRIVTQDGIDPLRSNIVIATHESRHMQQNIRFRATINNFFGFGYESSLNLVESPARKSEMEILRYYDSLPVKPTLGSPLLDAPLPNQDYGPPLA